MTTKKYEIIFKYIKDLSVEIPNAETFINSREMITKYSLGINITSNSIKNEMIEVITKLNYKDPVDRQKKSYLKFICKQLEECIPKNLKQLIIAYEPIWAIGSGLTPTIDDIIEVKESCINFLKKNKKINEIKFLYGGSVNSQNFFEIKDKCKVDGALVGGASLLEKEITNILKGDF